MIYQVVVTGPDGQKVSIDLCHNEKDMQRITVRELKDKIIVGVPRFNGPTENLKLIFGKKRLDDDTKRLVDYGIGHKSSIYMVICLDGGGGPETRTTVAAGDLQTSEMIYQVVVTGPDGQKVTINLCDNEKDMQRITVRELKDKIIEKIPGFNECIKDNLKLIFGNKRLEDDTKRLVDYGIMHRSSIHMIISLDGGGTPETGPTGDGMGDKEGETRRSKEQLMLNL